MLILIVLVIAACFIYAAVQAAIVLMCVVGGMIILSLAVGASMVAEGGSQAGALPGALVVFVFLCIGLWVLIGDPIPKKGDPGYKEPVEPVKKPEPLPPPVASFHLPDDPFWRTAAPARGHVPEGNTLTPLDVGPPPFDSNARPDQWWRKHDLAPEGWVEAYYIRKSRAQSWSARWLDNATRRSS